MTRSDANGPSGDGPSGDGPSGDGPSGDGPTGDRPLGAYPGRDALTGVAAERRHWPRRGGRGRGRGGEVPTVPDAQFTSYYGRPIIKRPVWRSPDIPAYLFLGGLAGAGSLLGAGARLTGRAGLARVSTVGAFAGGALSLVALVNDLGRPSRFLNMLRVFKVTSAMSVGSWLLAGYVPVAGAAAASTVTGRAPQAGSVAAAASAALGPAVAAYTAVLLSDTAVPAWHDGYRQMPFVFVASGATAAGGLGMLAAPVTDQGPARAFALLGVGVELAAFERMQRRVGMTAEPYSQGRGGAYVRAGKVLSVLGAAGTVASIGLGRRARSGRAIAAAAGAALLGASAATRWGVFHAGLQSADDPRYTVVPQRERMRRRTVGGETGGG